MPRPIRVAIVDLYDNEPNEGMRAIRELLQAADGAHFGVPVTFEIFETRYRGDVPDLSHDVYISTGGPGSPFAGEGKAWELDWFRWVDAVWNRNARTDAAGRKHVLFICHSFQMMVRHFGAASVIPRRSESFGVFPVHPTAAGRRDVLLRDLGDPFYATDFRHWQVVQPRSPVLDELGASVLAIEKKRPFVPLERAVMGIRMSEEVVGLQFHPEADPPGMVRHFRSPERAESVIARVGQEKYERIMHRLESPDYLKRTHDAVIPTFLREAVRALRPEAVAVEDEAAAA